MARINWIVGVAILLTACGGGRVTLEQTGPGDQSEAPHDALSDASAIDLAVGELRGLDLGLDLGADFGPATDVDGGELLPECQPGDGCFLDPCTTNEDCLSGFCLKHLGQGVCTVSCVEECPPGWSCQHVDTGSPDFTYLCVSNYPNLCKPCQNGAGCVGAAGGEDLCVDYGVAGNFCGGSCALPGTEGPTCPAGFVCKEVTSVDGLESTECQPETGVCECTATAIANQLWTPCELAGEFGTCIGKRVCLATGLSECDAVAAAAEVCNGVDDDCDGDIDEPDAVGGDLINLCDDGNDCTQDVCGGPDGCTNEALDGTECGDGDPCTVADHCVEGSCQGTLAVCDDSNPCTDDSCGIDGGCLFVDNVADCDDDNPCTVADQCQAGQCTGVAVACDCQVDADCAPLEDGNLCNGTLFCDTDQLPYQCAVAPGTEVVCPDPDGPEAACQAASCDPLSGDCSLVPANDGFACSDGDLCTIGDVCQEGACLPGTPVNCTDGNLCTDDSCDAQTGCQNVPNTLPCQDGNACTVLDQCQEGACVPGKPLACDDGNLCTDDGCDAVEGCWSKPNDLACDDGNVCTLNDQCQAGVCAPMAELSCDDDNLCTTDSCHPVDGCQNLFNSAPCDDGSNCTVGDHCQEGACVGGMAVECDDGNVCTDDVCTPEAGCQHVPNQLPCDDANECTINDQCAGGKCLGAGSLECDDANPCTKDICLPAGGCDHVNIDGGCSDGDSCTLNDSCVDGLCQPGPQLPCDDSNPCTADSCAEGKCLFVPQDGQCDDGNACTENDACLDGKCQASTPVVCDDSNPCTTDYCTPQDGCQTLDNALPCDDADACTVGDQCQAGECQSGAPLDCDDQNTCTADSCDALNGCQYLNLEVSCDDGNACTVGDSCADGACQSGVDSLDCDDANLCTDDICVPKSGCVNTPNADVCDDSNACTVGDVCKAGLCLPGLVPLACDDNILCTADTCDADLGCVHTLVMPCCGNQLVEEPEECDDGNYANNDACTATCQLPTCDDGYTNGLETDKDCGGSCPACSDGAGCAVAEDCTSGVCTEGVCQTPTCDDDVKNGSETDVDCGNGCAACADGMACSLDSDCVSEVCDGGVCQVPTCDDGVQNGVETDVDCGNGCSPCGDGFACGLDGDCESQVCTDGVCQVPTCDDLVMNGSETDVDCGGGCSLCGDGMGCEVDSDCLLAGLCVDGTCSLWGTGTDGALAVGSGTTTVGTHRTRVTGTMGETAVTALDGTSGLTAGTTIVIHQTRGTGAGAYEVVRIDSVNGATLNLTRSLNNSYSNSGNNVAQAVRVHEYTTATLTGGTLTAPDWNGATGGIMVIYAKESITLQGGTLNLSGRGFLGQGHGCLYRCADGYSGESISGPTGTNTAPARNGMGGGGGTKGQDCAAGGGGGHGTAGGAGSNGTCGSCSPCPHLGGQAGNAGGQADTSTLIIFGGGGGEGGGDEDGGNPGKGGDAGGILILRAPVITITGTDVQLNGLAGANGNQGSCGGVGCGMSGGGGGAGGAAYLMGETVALGSGKITATGGVGGTCTCSGAYPGGKGGDGRVAIKAKNVTGTTSPTFHALDYP